MIQLIGINSLRLKEMSTYVDHINQFLGAYLETRSNKINFFLIFQIWDYKLCRERLSYEIKNSTRIPSKAMVLLL